MTAAAAVAPALVYGLFKPECYTLMFEEHEWFNVMCLKFLLSKVLSYGIITGALIVKVPQIIKIVRSKSTEGLSPAMYVLENIGYLITVIYHVRHAYAFTTFGESIFLLIQGFVLVFLFGLYNKRLGAMFALGVTVFAAFAYYLYAMTTLEQLALFQTGTIGVFASSRLPQIYRNFAAGSTGVLSFITVFMNFAGNSARIFTTIQEVQDNVVLLGQVCSWILNSVLFLQVIIYWNSTKGEAKQQKKKSKKAQ